jgi:hypothetical protein
VPVFPDCLPYGDDPHHVTAPQLHYAVNLAVRLADRTHPDLAMVGAAARPFNYFVFENQPRFVETDAAAASRTQEGRSPGYPRSRDVRPSCSRHSAYA